MSLSALRPDTHTAAFSQDTLTCADSHCGSAILRFCGFVHCSATVRSSCLRANARRLQDCQHGTRLLPRVPRTAFTLNRSEAADTRLEMFPRRPGNVGDGAADARKRESAKSGTVGRRMGSPRDTSPRTPLRSVVGIAVAAPAPITASTPPDSAGHNTALPVHRPKHNTEVKTLCDPQGNVLYYLGEQLGRGAYGVVYKAIEISTGYFVAVKQIPTQHMGVREQEAVTNEIELLSKLNHFNIVKYSTVLRNEGCISIVTEFMESGSLAATLHRFGPLPEPLIAWYIIQSLKGLAYLHEQGVIHRDIKGANILLNKRAFVKLADFGVATKLMGAGADGLWGASAGNREVDQSTPTVVGTPYWMAPEIIEMSGFSTASDIWSIGCTVIELFTGYPPYYELAPMSALFRIVSDEHPPLPPNVSDGMADFLLKCFQKNAEKRPTAEELLKHPWLVKRTSELKRAETRFPGDESDSDGTERVPAPRMQAQRPRRSPRQPVGNARRGTATTAASETRAAPEWLDADDLDDVPAVEDLDEALDMEDSEAEMEGRGSAGTDPSPSSAATAHSVAAAPKPASGERRLQAAAAGQRQNGARLPPVIDRDALCQFADTTETYDDLGIEDEETLLGLSERLAAWQGLDTSPIRLYFQDSEESSDEETEAARTPSPDRGGTPEPRGRQSSQARHHRRRTPIPRSQRRGGASTAAVAASDTDESASSASSPQEIDDATAGELLVARSRAERGLIHRHYGNQARRSPRHRSNRPQSARRMPSDRYERLVWDEIRRKTSALVRADLTDEDSRRRALEAAASIIELFHEVSHQRHNLLVQHQLIAIVEVLEASGVNDEALVEQLLSFLNQVAGAPGGNVEENRQFRDHLYVSGIIPLLVEFSSRKYRFGVRMQAAYLLANMLVLVNPARPEAEATARPPASPGDCRSGDDALRRRSSLEPCDVKMVEMFVAARGLRALVNLLEEDYLRYHEMISIALDGMWQVMNTERQRHKHDCCRIMARDGVFDRIANALHWCIHMVDCRKQAAAAAAAATTAGTPTAAATRSSRDSASMPANCRPQLTAKQMAHVDAFAARLVDLWLTFPPADSVVEKHMSRESVLRPIVRMMPALADEKDQFHLLGSLRDLSGHQESHHALKAAGAISALVEMLGNNDMISGRVMITLFNLCRLRGPAETRARQEEAVSAQNGKLVRFLKRCIAAPRDAAHERRPSRGGGGSSSTSSSSSGERSPAIETGVGGAPRSAGADNPLRGFAVEILCSLDCSSAVIRQVLWSHQMIDWYVSVLLASVVAPNSGNRRSGGGESTAASSSSSSSDMTSLRGPMLVPTQQKALLEALVTWMRSSDAERRRVESRLVPPMPTSAAAAAAATTTDAQSYHLAVLAELPFHSNAPHALPSDASGVRYYVGDSAEYILGPYREMVEESAAMRAALGSYRGGAFCRNLAHLAAQTGKADVRREALAILSWVMRRMDPQVLPLLRQMVASEKSIVVRPEVQALLQRFGYDTGGDGGKDAAAAPKPVSLRHASSGSTTPVTTVLSALRLDASKEAHPPSSSSSSS